MSRFPSLYPIFVFCMLLGNQILCVDLSVVTTLSGSPTFGYRDSSAEESLFHSPEKIILLPSGEILVADRDNNCLRKISKSSFHFLLC